MRCSSGQKLSWADERERQQRQAGQEIPFARKKGSDMTGGRHGMPAVVVLARAAQPVRALTSTPSARSLS